MSVDTLAQTSQAFYTASMIRVAHGSRLYLWVMADGVGFEPTTPGFGSQCSDQTELTAYDSSIKELE